MAEIIVVRLGGGYETDMRLFYQYVSDRRIEKIQSYRYWEDAYRCLIGGLLVRYMLCDFLKTDNSSLRFTEDGNGKPKLYAGEGCFNLSHSKGRVVCIVDSFPVGIDVEEINDIDFEAVSGSFNHKEHRHIMELNDSDRKEYFYFLWTVKEAYLKMHGTGLLRDLSSFCVCREPGGRVNIADDKSTATGLVCESIRTDGGYRMAYAGFTRADIRYMSDTELLEMARRRLNS